jgi:hypothetical protein
VSTGSDAKRTFLSAPLPPPPTNSLIGAIYESEAEKRESVRTKTPMANRKVPEAPYYTDDERSETGNGGHSPAVAQEYHEAPGKLQKGKHYKSVVIDALFDLHDPLSSSSRPQESSVHISKSNADSEASMSGGPVP